MSNLNKRASIFYLFRSDLQHTGGGGSRRFLGKFQLFFLSLFLLMLHYVTFCVNCKISFTLIKAWSSSRICCLKVSKNNKDNICFTVAQQLVEKKSFLAPSEIFSVCNKSLTSSGRRGERRRWKFKFYNLIKNFSAREEISQEMSVLGLVGLVSSLFISFFCSFFEHVIPCWMFYDRKRWRIVYDIQTTIFFCVFRPCVFTTLDTNFATV